MGVSLKPSEMVAGGAVPESVLRFTRSRFTVWDYDGRAGPQATTLCLESTLVGEDGSEYVQRWSAGDPKAFQPTPDGQEIVAVGTRRALNDNTNLAELNRSIVKHGYPEGRVSDKAGETYDGLLAYVIWQDAPERRGLDQARAGAAAVAAAVAAAQGTAATPGAAVGDAGGGRRQQILVVGEIRELPWEASWDRNNPKQYSTKPGQQAPVASQPAAAAAATATAPAPPAASSNGSGGDAGFEAEVYEMILEAVASKGGDPIDRRELTTWVFANKGSHPQRGKVIAMIHDQGFLGKLVGEGKISMGAEGTTIGLPA